MAYTREMGFEVIEVTKLDGTTMHLNEDFIGRVEYAVAGQSALYTLDGSHIIVANSPDDVVSLIRAEKVALLRRVLAGIDNVPPSEANESQVGVTRLSEVRSK